MFYIIYKTTNVINGKYYIGKHQTKNLNDGYFGSGKLLKRAIKKYGLENFHREILFICKDERHMNTFEKILVVPDKEINYNLCFGGKGGFSYINKNVMFADVRRQNLEKSRTPEKIALATKHASETMKRTHAQGKWKYDTFTGKKHSEETKLKMSNSLKGKGVGKNNSQYGTCWVTDGSENLKIKKESLDKYLEQGYYKGRI